MTVFDPDSDSLPKLSELETKPGAPPQSAWFWGENDELGRLNLLTPRRVASAARLIQTGERVGLNFPAELPNPPFFGREPFKHKLKQSVEYGFDDLHDMNTQSGSQWDGFRHVGMAHEGSYVWYNGITADDIHKTSKMGLQAWAKQCIAGRGVLLDFYSFAGKSYDPFTTRDITTQELLDCARAQNLTFKYGDILIIRSGWSEAYRKLDEAGRQAIGSKGWDDLRFAGLDRSPETLAFLHDNYFAAVAGDAPSFESWPMNGKTDLHYFLLPRWGVPIGELWDLDGLAELCKKHNRYEFFFTSSPCNVQGMLDTHPASRYF
ncbi:hypothetical protein Z517_04708 [Fonsecaea pedrosoi CBS 271.37]|uniref:Unplaced genomic scaffold supercont1.3, whole genome shotgun sequence n=1 Tax=Fonsecaea pedrosoi CBS 271.37 TaxID=1442368 RepID=A0A0D2F4S7_9EURO|nr:uncharacterized protein Z517_04708 [Fonsecaea pedrosoi CBS 271.37]KIW81682.1 hypothetical protein Z517_04708 [Fonsecaea pedrosoi CBS 271.37]